MGAGGYVAGPVGLAAVLLRVPLVLTEADSHLGIANRALAPFARRVCLAFAIEGRDRVALPRHRPAGAAAGDRPRGRARRVRDRRRRDVRARVRRLAGRAVDQRGGDRGVRGGVVPGPAHLRRARRAVAARSDARPPTTSSSPTSCRSATRWPRPTSRSPARAARCSSSPPTACPAILIPYPHATADHQTGNAHWMADAGAAVVLPDAELTRGPPRIGGRDPARRPRPPRRHGPRVGRPRAAVRRARHRRRDRRCRSDPKGPNGV